MEALAADDIKNVGSLILSRTELQDDIRKKLCTTIQEEIRFTSLKSSNSILRKTNFEDLEFFSIQVILDEWKEKAPTFYQFLLACISNPSQQRNKHKKNDAFCLAWCQQVLSSYPYITRSSICTSISTA